MINVINCVFLRSGINTSAYMRAIEVNSYIKKNCDQQLKESFFSGKPTQKDKSPCLPEDCWPAETKGRKERSKAPVLQFSAKSANKKKEQLGGWEITYFATNVKRVARTDWQKRN